MDLHVGQLALVDLRDDVERAFRPVAEEKGLRFAIESDERLPAAIVTDEQRLQQILRNLLSNAFKFTHRGSVTLRIAAGQDEHARVLGDRHRRGHPRREARADLRGLPAGRRDDLAQVRRHGPGPVDQPRDRAPPGRRDPRLERARGRQHVHPVPAPGTARGRDARGRLRYRGGIRRSPRRAPADGRRGAAAVARCRGRRPRQHRARRPCAARDRARRRAGPRGHGGDAGERPQGARRAARADRARARARVPPRCRAAVRRRRPRRGPARAAQAAIPTRAIAPST